MWDGSVQGRKLKCLNGSLLFEKKLKRYTKIEMKADFTWPVTSVGQSVVLIT